MPTFRVFGGGFLLTHTGHGFAEVQKLRVLEVAVDAGGTTDIIAAWEV